MTVSMFVQACNDKGISNIAAMSSTRSRYSVVTLLHMKRATTSHHVGYGSAQHAFQSAEKGSNTHMYDNVLRMCVKKSEERR